MTKQEKSNEPLSPSKRRKDKRKKYTTNTPSIEKVVRKIIAEGGSPKLITDEARLDRIEGILGGGAEFKGGGRAVMKKGGKV